MNVLFRYKDYMIPDFFQGPTYIIYREPSKIKNHKYPDDKVADEDIYDVSEFPPIRPQPILGMRPPRKLSDSN